MREGMKLRPLTPIVDGEPKPPGENEIWIDPAAVTAVAHPGSQFDRPGGTGASAVVVLQGKAVVVRHMTVSQVISWMDYWMPAPEQSGPESRDA